MTELIRLTMYGESLSAYPHTNMDDEKKLSTCVGMHHICNGFVDIIPVAQDFNALACRRCRLRVLIPNKVKTFGELREHLNPYNTKAPQ